MRPALFHINTTINWVLTTYDPDKPGVEKDADSTPSVTVRKNGSAVGDSVTVTKRSATTGIYDCSYNPSGEAEGDTYTLEETATITGSTSASATYRYRWSIEAIAVERGTDSALTTLGSNAPAGWINNAALADDAISAAKIAASAITAAKFAADAITASVIADGAIDAGAIAANALTAAKIAADAVTLIQAGLATASALATAQASLTTLESRLSAARAGYLDYLNVGGIVASQADINALNQSASRRIILTTQLQWERPESGSSSYFIEARTYDGDGAAVNADSNPTLTVTGAVTGSLAANLGAISNPATGVYRWTYSQPSNATLEAIRVDVSATIGGSAFPISAMTQSCDFVSATWTTSDASKLTAIYNKLPSRAYLGGTTTSTGAPLLSDFGLASANLDAQFDEMLADLATREANIRGADNDTLKTLSDQLDTKLPTASYTAPDNASIVAAAASAASADSKLTTPRLSKIDNAASSTDVTNAVTSIKGADGDTLKTLSDQLDALAAGSGALTPDQQAQLDAIETKTALLNPAPTGSILLVDSGDYYCTRQDVELVFGQSNVAKWADVDNESDLTFIEDRITTMIALAHEQTNDALRQGGYTVPVEAPRPASLTYNVAALAGVLLYEARGAADSENDNGVHRLTPFRNRWEKYIKQLLSQQIRIDATRQNSTTAPQVY